jgi:hypothetical protein
MTSIWSLQECQNERVVDLIGQQDARVAAALTGTLGLSPFNLAGQWFETKLGKERRVVGFQLRADDCRGDDHLAKAVGTAQLGLSRQPPELGRDVSPRAGLDPRIEYRVLRCLLDVRADLCTAHPDPLRRGGRRFRRIRGPNVRAGRARLRSRARGAGIGALAGANADDVARGHAQRRKRRPGVAAVSSPCDCPPRSRGSSDAGGDQRRSDEAGFSLHLVKPVNVERIVRFSKARPTGPCRPIRIRVRRGSPPGAALTR